MPRQKMLGFFEWTSIREILLRNEIDCVLDVGASVGKYAQSLRHIGYRGLILSFEPVPEQFKLLNKTMGHDPMWQGYNFALGNVDAKQNMHVTVDSIPMSSMLRHKDATATVRDIEISIKRLDSIWAEILEDKKTSRIFLKMDTQGFDVKVVEGAGKKVEMITALQSELSVEPIYYDMPHYLEALNIYESAGFRLAGLFEIARNKEQETVMEMNCLMVRPNL